MRVRFLGRGRPGPRPPPETPPARSRPTDVPVTLTTAMPPLAEPTMKELEVNAVASPLYSYSRVSYNDRTKDRPLRGHRAPADLPRAPVGRPSQVDADDDPRQRRRQPRPRSRSYLRGEAEEYFRSRGITLSPIPLERIRLLRPLRLRRDARCAHPRPPGGGHLVRLAVRRSAVHLPREGRVDEDETSFPRRRTRPTRSSSCWASGARRPSASPPLSGRHDPGRHRVQATYAREITTEERASPSTFQGTAVHSR